MVLWEFLLLDMKPIFSLASMWWWLEYSAGRWVPPLVPIVGKKGSSTAFVRIFFSFSFFD
jgi:hypothetical protein